MQEDRSTDGVTVLLYALDGDLDLTSLMSGLPPFAEGAHSPTLNISQRATAVRCKRFCTTSRPMLRPISCPARLENR